MNNTPLISVIMPVYNGSKFLEEAIKSVLNQTEENFEFIIINDGSTDNSLEIIQYFEKNDKRIRVISRENRGLVSSLNEGIASASGKFIARMDADDISLPHRFSTQIELLEKENGDICGSHHHIILEEGSFLSSFIAPIEEYSIIVSLGNSVPFAHGNLMIRRSFIVENNLSYGMDNLNYVEDYALWIKFFKHGAKFINADDFLFKYRHFSTSFSKTKKKEMIRERRDISKRFLKENKQLMSDSIEKMLEKKFLSANEEEFLIFTSFLHLIVNRSMLFFKCMKKVNKLKLLNSLIIIFMGRY